MPQLQLQSKSSGAERTEDRFRNGRDSRDCRKRLNVAFSAKSIQQLQDVAEDAGISRLLAAACLTSLIVKQGPRRFNSASVERRDSYLEMKVKYSQAREWREWGLRLGHGGRRGFIAWCVETAFANFEWDALVNYLRSRPDMQEVLELCRKISS